MPATSRLLRTVAAATLGLMLAFSAQAVPKVVKKVPPEFPAEAAKKGVSTGVVKAKISIDADGKVTDVEILEAEPKRLFDRAVKDALMEWRFEPGEKTTHEVKLVFKNED
ncbi:energy transducer TonB [Roseateles cellulosilyticus]|uniref:Protein TonB n=1 Tax=Pelomonas cellulosilytica TaxID=2906762 RepID=A0ABS8XWS5_9BURK|nr:energy transducer TonB [Pelomonas sp. P8]MCE4557109.1 energy transducer TonB [Pelomonas sp. P8]